MPCYPLVDYSPNEESFREAVLRGLRAPQKFIESKFLYDDVGAQLFERICLLDEYYPTRTERAILQGAMPDLVRLIGPGARLVEFGSGASEKTRLLLDALDGLSSYVPIDISRRQLVEASAELAVDYPNLDIVPVCADYTTGFTIPETERAARHSVVFFPGSTIGNFTPDAAADFLRRTAALVGPAGGLLIGVDAAKEPSVLERAYNDRAGVTAAFNLNLLGRINRELDATFDLRVFVHRALYDKLHGRIEMRLESRVPQLSRVAGTCIGFRDHEYITTEYSYKYTATEFTALATEAGFHLQESFTDASHYFYVYFFTV